MMRARRGLAAFLALTAASLACIATLPWLGLAYFYFALQVGDHMDDGGCYGGHPVWAVAQALMAIVGIGASWWAGGAAVKFERGRGDGWSPVTALALAAGAATIWVALIATAPAQHIVSSHC